MAGVQMNTFVDFKKSSLVLLRALILAAGMALISGCATYIPPSGRADLKGISSVAMQESFDARPAAGFPAGIAAVRVQAPGYQS